MHAYTQTNYHTDMHALMTVLSSFSLQVDSAQYAIINREREKTLQSKAKKSRSWLIKQRTWIWMWGGVVEIRALFTSCLKGEALLSGLGPRRYKVMPVVEALYHVHTIMFRIFDMPSFWLIYAKVRIYSQKNSSLQFDHAGLPARSCVISHDGWISHFNVFDSSISFDMYTWMYNRIDDYVCINVYVYKSAYI